MISPTWLHKSATGLADSWRGQVGLNFGDEAFQPPILLILLEAARTDPVAMLART